MTMRADARLSARTEMAGDPGTAPAAPAAPPAVPAGSGGGTLPGGPQPAAGQATLPSFTDMARTEAGLPPVAQPQPAPAPQPAQPPAGPPQTVEQLQAAHNAEKAKFAEWAKNAQVEYAKLKAQVSGLPPAAAQTAAPPPAGAKWEKAMERFLGTDAAGNVVERPGAPAGTLALYNQAQFEQQQRLQTFAENPEQALAPYLAKAREEARKEAQVAYEQQRQEEYVNGYLSQNAQYIYAAGPDGRTQTDVAGNPVLTDLGGRFYKAVHELQSIGVTDKVRLLKYAEKLVAGDDFLRTLQTRQAQPVAPAAPAAPQAPAPFLPLAAPVVQYAQPQPSGYAAPTVYGQPPAYGYAPQPQVPAYQQFAPAPTQPPPQPYTAASVHDAAAAARNAWLAQQQPQGGYGPAPSYPQQPAQVRFDPNGPPPDIMDFFRQDAPAFGIDPRRM